VTGGPANGWCGYALEVGLIHHAASKVVRMAAGLVVVAMAKHVFGRAMAGGAPSTLDGLHQRLADRGQQARKGNRLAILRPRIAIHLDQKLGMVRARNAGKLDFEVLMPLQLLDRNSNVCFHKCTVVTGLQKSPVHGPMQSQSFNHS